jgi:phospholipid-binding lipoprotein MlaA
MLFDKDMNKFSCIALICLMLLFFSGCSPNSAEPAADAVQTEKQGNSLATEETSEQETDDDFSEESESAKADESGEEDDDFGEFEEEFEKSDKEVFDPLSGYNRAVTVFNDKLYLWILDPVARGYRYVVPTPARIGVNNFFLNLLYPIRLVNNLLQLKVKNAGEETLRFVTNSTIGVLGFWDPAKEWFGLEAHHEDFGQTLGFYGVGGGFHIVLPILGPSNLRDTLSMYPDQYAKYDGKYYLDPVSYLEPTEVEWGVRVFEEVNFTSLHIGEYQSFKKDAFDWYLFLRDGYEQRREKLIKE